MEIWRRKDNGVTTLTFWGHVMSSVTWPFDLRWATSYGWSIVTMRVKCTVMEISHLKSWTSHAWTHGWTLRWFYTLSNAMHCIVQTKNVFITTLGIWVFHSNMPNCQCQRHVGEWHQTNIRWLNFSHSSTKGILNTVTTDLHAVEKYWVIWQDLPHLNPSNMWWNLCNAHCDLLYGLMQNQLINNQSLKFFHKWIK